MNRCFARLRLCCLVIAASLLAIPAEAAAPASLEIKSVKVGLNGNYQVGSWTPVTATVMVSGGSAQPTQLVVIAPDADGQLVRTAGPFKTLTPGKLEILQTRFMPGRISGDIVVRLETQDGAVHEQRLRSGDSTTEKATLRPGLRQDVTLWGLCGLPAAVFDKAISKSNQAAVNSETITRLDEMIPELITLTPGDVPDAAVDLAAMDVLILAANASTPGSSSTFLSQLSPSQQQALRDWVQLRGGHLVVSVGSQLTEFQKSELGRWLKLPLEAEGSLRQLDGLESYSPYPVPLQVDGTVAAIRIGTTTGNILARSLDGPLLLQLPYGFGRVTFLAVDLHQPPVSNWEGLGHLLRKVLSTERDQVREIRIQGAQLAKSSINDLSSQLFAGLEEFPGVIRLSLWSVMALLGIYILIVGPLDYLIVHRWLQRPHLTWITLTLWVVLGSALIVGLSNRLNGTRLRSTQLEVVDVDETSRLVRGQSWLTLYSPRTTRSAIELAQVMPNWSAKGPLATTSPLVSWAAPAENRIGGLYREGGVQLTQREYRSSESAAEPKSSPGYADFPLQVWSTGRFVGEWSGETPQLVESHLVSSELGRLTGTVEHRLPGALGDCLLAYANRVYMPVVRRVQGAGNAELAPHFVWEIGGGQPVEQRELRSFLTEVYLKQVRTGDDKKLNTTMLDVQRPYDATRRDVSYILRMLTFHQAAGGRDYTGMRHDVLGNFDMSSHLRLGRAVLLGRLTKGSTGKTDPASQQTAAEWKVGSEILNGDSAQTYVRIVLPVNREREEDAKVILEPDK